MSESKIEWTNKTWNPVTGCRKVSPGCDHCYAERFAERFRGVKGHPYEQGFDVKLWPERLGQPRRWRKPSMVFVNSMSDLFQTGVPFGFVDEVWNTMLATPQHTYQILTKRPGRMRKYSNCDAIRTPFVVSVLTANPWPLPNVWLGTSVEDRKRTVRIKHLRQVQAAVRFLSLEPLLGDLGELDLDGIGWVIVGGESGPGARPMDPAWARSIRDQCRAAAVPFFYKQSGARQGKGSRELDGKRWEEMP